MLDKKFNSSLYTKSYIRHMSSDIKSSTSLFHSKENVVPHKNYDYKQIKKKRRRRKKRATCMKDSQIRRAQ